MTKRAAIYARLSRDREGNQTATFRQVDDCRAFAAARGWEIVATYEESDVSASGKVKRPEYERMVSDLSAGAFDVVLAWKLDRLLRRPADWEDLWRRCEMVGANVATVSDGIDTTTPLAGKLLPRILTIAAEMELDNLSIREKRKHEETLASGKWKGGGSRPFGLTADWSAEVPVEADHIRDAVRRILSGTSLYAIVKDWNETGLRTPTGKVWSVQLLRSMLGSPRLSGRRVHHGEIIGMGNWPAIIDPEPHDRLLAHLSRRAGPSPAGRFLLSGMVRCGICDETMYVRRRHRDKARFYGCEKVPGGRGCGRCHIQAEGLERYVTEAVIAALDSPELAKALASRDQSGPAEGVLEAVRADEAALEELSRDHYVDRIISRPEFLAARDELVARIGEGRKQLARSNGSGMAASVVGAGARVRAAWEASPLDWRRALVGSVVEAVKIAPAARRGQYDEGRIEIAWRY